VLRILLTASVVMALVACASRPAVPIEMPKIKSIAVIAATNPIKYSLDNRSALVFVLPIAGTANYFDSKEKAKKFNEKLMPVQESLAGDFTDVFVQSLRQQGFEVQLLTDVVRRTDDPDDVDYAKLATTADAVLHVRFEELGLLSPRSSIDYLPRVNARGTLFTRDRKHYVYDGVIYYGVDAREGKDWALMPDPKFACPSFEAVIERIEDVRSMFHVTSIEVARKMSAQLSASLK